jgi:hypothetical protein
MKNKALYFTVILLFSLLLYCQPALSEDIGSFDFLSKEFSAACFKISTYPKNTTGTGFIMQYNRSPYVFDLLIMNNHVIEGADSIKIVMQLADSNYVVTDSTSTIIDLNAYRKSNVIFDIDKRVDLVALPFDLAKIERKNLLVIGIGEYVCTKVSALFPGQKILFAGYPLGIAIDGIKPILRFGMIAGIDNINNLILIDADAFGGSSGSPVFLDIEQPSIKSSLKDDVTKVFVGIIASYEPAKTKLINERTREVQMILTENSGIAYVVPSEYIRKIGDKVKDNIIEFLKGQEKGKSDFLDASQKK